MTLTESNTQPELTAKNRATWLLKAADKINAIHNLRPNWDSYGALRPNSLSLQHAALFVHLLIDRDTAEPHITPNSKGNVCFEWCAGQNSLSVELTPLGDALFYSDSEDQQIEATERFPYAKIVSLAEQF